MTPAIVELTDVSKNYQALRPLRIERLTVGPGELVAILGLDQPAAEVLVNLVTGAMLPDSGIVRVFGRPTNEIADSADWLAVVDRFGIVTERAVLLDQLSVVQNLSMPFTLEIEPPPPDVIRQAADLAREVGLGDHLLAQPVATLGPPDRARIRLARALALEPAALLVEHLTAGFEPDAALGVAADLQRVARRRGAALIAITADRRFADAVGTRVLMLEPASGRWKESAVRRWFGGRLG